jgi:hypothetical protein
MSDHIVVDVEIQKTIEETPGGWDATDKLGVSVACVWEYKTQRMRIYGPEDVGDLQVRLLKADKISGYNIHKFDFPVIWGYGREEWMHETTEKVRQLQNCLKNKTNDLLRRIWKALDLNPGQFDDLHKGWSLDVVATSTLGYGKIGYGGNAPKWFQAGLIQKVANYCADDVALERDLADYIEKYGRVLNGNRVLRIPPWNGQL